MLYRPWIERGSTTKPQRAGAVLATLALGLAFTPPAQAQSKACVPPPAGVVGLSGPPDWTTLATSVVDDPRWHGAARETFPRIIAGGTPDFTSRLVQESGVLWLQLQTLGDATPGNTTTIGPNTFFRDSYYVGFATSDLATISIARIAIDPSATPPISLIRWDKSGGAWSVNPGVPGWLTARTGWISTTVGAEAVPWAADLKITVASTPGGGAKMWYAAVISPSGFGSVLPYAWPDVGGFVEPANADTSQSAATWGAQFDAIGAANWGDYTPVTGGSYPAGCGGVTLESSNVRTTNTPDYRIYDNASNTFQAQLTVAGGAAMPAAGDVKARFRLANWGMTIGVGGDFNEIPGGGFANNLTNNAAGLIQVTCPYSGTSCPPWVSGTNNADQCMLVELQGASTTPVRFLKDSAWRNMIFAHMSSFEHEAEISLKGLPAETTPRDVYIYVQAHNMPATLDPKPPGATQPTPTPTPAPTVDPVKGDKARQDPPPKKDVSSPADPRNDPYLSYKLAGLNAVEQRVILGGPTYEVRGYRDTGKGAPGWQLLAPMVPYGYIVDHAGSLIGWQHELTGSGTTTVTTLIPGVLYKISVLPGGVGKIKNHLEALEPPRTPPCPHCCCNIRETEHATLYWVGAAALGLAFTGRRRRRTAKRD